MPSLRFTTSAPLPLFSSLFGLLDLKLGVTIIALFGLLNKVVGVYGIMAVFTGGSALQLSYYSYSILTVVPFLWGLRAVAEESTSTLLFAHLYLVDHLVSTLYTTVFALIWYLYTPHDGRRVANSVAQKGVMDQVGGVIVDETSRVLAAQGVWKSERMVSGVILVLGWSLKVYFILLLYSFALHLRRGTYHSLPLSFVSTKPTTSSTISPSSFPLHTTSPPSHSRSHSRTHSRTPSNAHRHRRKLSRSSPQQHQQHSRRNSKRYSTSFSGSTAFLGSHDSGHSSNNNNNNNSEEGRRKEQEENYYEKDDEDSGFSSSNGSGSSTTGGGILGGGGGHGGGMGTRMEMTNLALAPGSGSGSGSGLGLSLQGYHQGNQRSRERFD